MYVLKIALRPFRTSTVSMLLYAFTFGGIAFLLAALFWAEAQLVPHLLSKMREERSIVFLSSTVQENEVSQLADRVREQLRSQIRVVSKKESLELLSKAYPEMAAEMRELGGLEATLIPRYLVIDRGLSKDELEQISSLSGLERVQTLGVRQHEWVAGISRSLWLLDFVKVALATLMITLVVLLARVFQSSFQDYRSLAVLFGGGGMASIAPNLLSGALWGFLAAAFSFVGAWLLDGSFTVWRQVLPGAELRSFLETESGWASVVGSIGVGILSGWLSRTRLSHS